jgi:hypothetical protein
VTQHYHVIGNFTGAMAQLFVCKACGKVCRRDTSHTCDQTCSKCMASPPCVKARVRITCLDCNRHFRSQSYFSNHKLKHGTKKVFVRVNASANHVTNSLNPPENMNAANTIAKRVKPASREDISAICSH